MSNDIRNQLGRTGEQLAADHLARRGFTILDRNFRTRWGELDIVACDARTIVFCEVKTRLQREHARRADPLEAVREGKRSQVRRMAARWLVERVERPRAAELRFDAIGITLDGAGRLLRLEHLEGAF